MLDILLRVWYSPRIMVKRLTKHTIYEIWNEYLAESVFIDHKPTKAEIEAVCESEDWERSSHTGLDGEAFVHRYIHVEKLKKLYTSE